MYQTAQKIWSVLTPKERKALSGHLLSGIFISVLDILFLGVIVWLINSTSGQQGYSSSYFSTTFVRRHIFTIAVVVTVLFTIKNVVGYIIAQTQYQYSYAVAARLSESKLMQYFQRDYFNHINTDSSVYLYQVAQQPVEFSQYILSGLQQIVIQAALIALSVAAILWYNTKLFLLVIIFILPPVLIASYLMKKKVRHTRSATRINSERSLQYLKESLSAYVESHIFDKHIFFSGRYSSYQMKLNLGLANLQSTQLLPPRLFEVFAVAGVFIIMVVNLGSTGNVLNLVTVGVFMAAAYKIIPGMVKIITYSAQIKAYEHALKIMEPVSDTTVLPTIVDKAENISRIDVVDLGYRYTQNYLFTNLNFELVAGDFVGISGASGRGKTSLLNVLLGFTEPSCGHLLFNALLAGKEMRCSYRQRISYVKQSELLIHDSILKNIVLTDEPYDEIRFGNALKFCGLSELVNNNAVGIYQLVTEGGNNLSGGQRQRVMLARALYKDFDLLILDEPFSELDEAAECKILQNLQTLTNQGKMILFVTHNQQSLKFCNKIIKLDEA